MRVTFVRFLAVITAVPVSALGMFAAEGPKFQDSARTSAEVRLGARFFSEFRFAQYFQARAGDDVNARLATADPVLAKLAALAPPGSAFPGPAMSCRACHFSDDLKPHNTGAMERRLGVSGFADNVARSAVPARDDERSTTPRNSPSLVDAFVLPAGATLFHFDAEFASPEALVKETFLGRNFGWLPRERAVALRHLSRVIREDNGAHAAGSLAPGGLHLSYTALLRGEDPAIPSEWRLPSSLRLDTARATDDEIADACATLVGAFVRSLRFSRDRTNLHNGTPYDAFLALNRIPRAPARDQTPEEYGRRIGEQVAALRAPRFVDDPARTFRLHDQPFRFGEIELQGMRIFFRGAVSRAQKSGAGNCAECHVPPHFSDFKFHNTGAAEDDYDALHGAGSFLQIMVPRLTSRDVDFDRWLPPTPRHPYARGPFLLPATKEAPEHTDLGLWNVYGNPDLPLVQAPLERLLNPAGRLSRDDVLALTLGRFKTSSVRNLGHSAPYLHTGHVRSLEEVIVFYERMSSLAHAGVMRNAPPEFHAMRLDADDVAPLTAFLRALNEDYDGPAVVSAAP